MGGCGDLYRGYSRQRRRGPLTATTAPPSRPLDGYGGVSLCLKKSQVCSSSLFFNLFFKFFKLLFKSSQVTLQVVFKSLFREDGVVKDGGGDAYCHPQSHPPQPTCKQDGRRWSTGVKGHGRYAVLRTLDAGAVAPP